MSSRCANLAGFALLVVLAHEHVTCVMRDVWEAPRTAVLRAWKRMTFIGHYTIPLLASVVSTLPS